MVLYPFAIGYMVDGGRRGYIWSLDCRVMFGKSVVFDGLFYEIDVLFVV